jgi:hypothetical protein
MSIINLQIPEALRNQFKALCSSRGETMREVLLELIKKEVEKGKPKR